MPENLKSVTRLEREYGENFNKYKAYINDSLIGDIVVEYLGKEPQAARKKAIDLEKLLHGELAQIEVKRGNSWNVFLAKIS